MKKRIIILVLLICAIFMLALIPAEAGEIPSLFRNDEVWYRDSLSPLIERDGEYYIPLGLCEMFDYITAEVPKEDNILIYNNDTGDYISALLSDSSAAVNGEIIKTTVFREGGEYYLNAGLVCSVFGFTSDVYTDAGGKDALRISDSVSDVSLFELAEKNRRRDEAKKDVFVDDTDFLGKKTIYILCRAEYGNGYSVCDILNQTGTEFTVLIDRESNTEEIYYAVSHGEYVLTGEDGADGFDALNDRVCDVTARLAHAVIADVTEDEKKEIENRGYALIEPDFKADGSKYAVSEMKEIIDYLAEHDSCIVYIENTWNGREIVQFISELDPATYRTANIGS